MANRWGNNGNSDRLWFLGLQNHCRWWTAAMKLDACYLEEKLWKQIKKQRYYFADKCPYSQSHGFSSSHVWMWELDHKEGWALKNWCFQSVVLEKTLESPLESKLIKPVNPKGNQPWIFIGRSDAGAEAPILWPLDSKNRLIGKDPDSWKYLGQEEKRAAEDEMALLIQWTWVWANCGK